MRKLRVAALLGGLMLTGGASAQLRVITHNSFDLDPALIAQFERESGVRVQLIKGGDAGALASRLLLTRANPVADVVYGIDNALLPRLRDAGVLLPYRSPLLAQVPAALHLGDHLTPVNYGYVALNVHREFFERPGAPPLPRSLEDLTRPEYRGLVAVPSPATSSPGQGFLLATAAHFGTERAMNWWRQMMDNGLTVTRGWSEAYYNEFSQHGGTRPIVLSYASSPAAEVFYAEVRPERAPTANLLLPGSVFTQIEGVGILRGTRQEAAARRFVDFMLSEAVQRDIPTRMWVYPARSGVPLNEVYRFANNPGVRPLPERQLAASQWLTGVWTREVLRR